MKASLWLYCAWALAAETLTVTGRVTNAVTHGPIDGVSVFLFGTSLQATTDASGTFSIRNVKAGRYRLVALRQDFESTWMETLIEDGRDPAPFALTLVPWPSVQGRVLDSERQPVARVRVQAISSRSASGIVRESTTDADGRYALKSLTPGQYRLVARPPAIENAAESTELAATWFPSTTEQRDAETLMVVPGSDLFGYDIRLRAVPVLRVSGRVIDERGDMVARAKVETRVEARTATTRDDGTFELTRVRQGETALRATWRRGDVDLRGFANIIVNRHDVQDVEVRVQPPVAVFGEMELNGQRSHPCEGKAKLVSVDGQGETARANLTENGIRFDAVYPGRYRLAVVPGWTWGRHYLESVRLGSRDITADDFDVVPGMPPFTVVLSTEGGRVQGTVEGGAAGLLVLTPKNERLRFAPFIVTTFFEGGSFALDNVRPGDYYAFALQGSFNPDEMQNSEYARTFLHGARTLRVARNSTATLSLVYVTADSQR